MSAGNQDRVGACLGEKTAKKKSNNTGEQEGTTKCQVEAVPARACARKVKLVNQNGIQDGFKLDPR